MFSGPSQPVRRLLSAVDGKNYYHVIEQSEIDGVGKPGQDGSTRLTVDSRMRERICRDPIEQGYDRFTEPPAEAVLTLVVPCASVKRIGLGLRPKDDLWRHSSAKERGANGCPGNRRRGVGQVLCPASIECFAAAHIRNSLARPP